MRKLFGFIIIAGLVTTLIYAGKQATALADAGAKTEKSGDIWGFMPDPLAEIDGKKISKQEFVEFFMSNLPDGKLPPMATEQLLKQIAPRMVKQYVESKLILKAAVNAGFKPSQELAEKFFKQSIAEASPEEKKMFENGLAMQNQTIDEFIKQNAGNKAFQENAAIGQWIKSTVASKVTVSPQEVKAYFDKNKERFQDAGDREDTIRASHILVKFKDSTPESDKAAKDKAASILKRIQNDESFEKIAAAESECPSGKMAGGSLGAFAKGQMVKPFEEVAWALNPGELSDLVKTEFGYHIIRRDASKGASAKQFSEVKATIGKMLKDQKVAQIVNNEVQKMMKAANVKIFIEESKPEQAAKPE